MLAPGHLVVERAEPGAGLPLEPGKQFSLLDRDVVLGGTA